MVAAATHLTGPSAVMPPATTHNKFRPSFANNENPPDPNDRAGLATAPE